VSKDKKARKINLAEREAEKVAAEKIIEREEILDDLVRPEKVRQALAATAPIEVERHTPDAAVEEFFGKPEPKRDHWGRPLIPQLDGGKAVGYTRMTTAAKILDDPNGLFAWKQALTGLGIMKSKALQAAFATSTWADDKSNLKKLVEDAMVLSGEADKAGIGTAFHKVVENYVSGIGQLVPDEFEKALDAVKETLKDCEVLASELFVVNDELKVAGTLDLLVRLPNGEVVIADVKTGSVAYGGLPMSAQLGGYANSEPFDTVANERTAWPKAPTKDYGIIIQVDIDAGTVDLHRVDLIKGFTALRDAVYLRDMRKSASRWLVGLPSWEALEVANDSELLEAAASPEALVESINAGEVVSTPKKGRRTRAELALDAALKLEAGDYKITPGERNAFDKLGDPREVPVVSTYMVDEDDVIVDHALLTFDPIVPDPVVKEGLDQIDIDASVVDVTAEEILEPEALPYAQGHATVLVDQMIQDAVEELPIYLSPQTNAIVTEMFVLKKIKKFEKAKKLRKYMEENYASWPADIQKFATMRLAKLKAAKEIDG
jgi:hypothetical protein